MVNRGCLVGHHTDIGDYVSLQSGANVAGSCRIGEATFIAMGAVVIDHLIVGSHSIVGAGAVVVQRCTGSRSGRRDPRAGREGRDRGR